MIPTEHVQLLQGFVALARANPSILHAPELDFYKQYLLDLGAKLPTDESSKPSSNTDSSKAEPETKTSSFEQQEDEPEIAYPEIDNSGVIPEDDGEELPNGDSNKEVTDEELEKANEERDKGGAAFGEGNFEDALKHYTAAIKLNPGSALLHAKRANVLLKLSKPIAAIRDCDKAISINPDSAQGYKFRGRANRLLGRWIEAHKDLALACKIDYDDVAAEWLKEVEANAKKLQEYNRVKQRREEEKEIRERQDRVRRAQEANRRAAEEAAKSHADIPDYDSEGPGAGLGDLLNDPELLKTLQEDPSLLTKLSEVMQKPQNIMKYMGDPAVMKLIQKLTAKKAGGSGGFPFGGFPGAGGAGGFPFGGFPGGAGGNPFGGAEKVPEPETKPTCPSEPTQPKKAPEPDLD